MKIIDADKLMKSLNPKESVWVGLVLSELIDNAPTVEAIPKEWIRDYMLRLPDGSEAYECILVMLEDWEDEQARLFEKQITEKCVSAERFAEWEKENGAE